MGWVDDNLAKGKEVFGMIVCEKLNDKLISAMSVNPKMALVHYSLELVFSEFR